MKVFPEEISMHIIKLSKGDSPYLFWGTSPNPLKVHGTEGKGRRSLSLLELGPPSFPACPNPIPPSLLDPIPLHLLGPHFSWPAGTPPSPLTLLGSHPSLPARAASFPVCWGLIPLCPQTLVFLVWGSSDL